MEVWKMISFSSGWFLGFHVNQNKQDPNIDISNIISISRYYQVFVRKMCSIHFLSLHDMFTYTKHPLPLWVSELPPCTKCKISALERKNPKLRDLGEGCSPSISYGESGVFMGLPDWWLRVPFQGCHHFTMNSPRVGGSLKESTQRNLTQQGRYDGCRTHPIPLRKTTVQNESHADTSDTSGRMFICFQNW